MYKSASKAMQRVSTKAYYGIGEDKPSEGGGKRSLRKSTAYAQAVRVARIRECFELQQQIEKALRSGENVAHLRQRLDALRSGREKPNVKKSQLPRQDRAPAITVADRNAAERRPVHYRQKKQGKKALFNEKTVQIDLTDLGHEKLTFGGIAIIKMLLAVFDVTTISDTLEISAAFVEKVKASPLMRMAPDLGPEEGVILAGILESRLRR